MLKKLSLRSLLIGLCFFSLYSGAETKPLTLRATNGGNTRSSTKSIRAALPTATTTAWAI